MNLALRIPMMNEEELQNGLKANFHYSMEKVRNQFSYLRVEQQEMNIFVFPGLTTSDDQNSSLFYSFLKGEEVGVLISIQPLVSLWSDDKIRDIILFEDLVELSPGHSIEQVENYPSKIMQKPLFCPALRQRLLAMFMTIHQPVKDYGVVAGIRSNRTETAAEAMMLQHWKLHGLSYHIVPEVFLAKKHHLHYAPIGVVYRHSVNLEAMDDAVDYLHEWKRQAITVLEFILHHAALFADIHQVCDRIEFREVLGL